MSDFFDLPEDVIANSSRNSSSERKNDPNVYDPDPSLYNGSYKSVFRFVPYIHDKTKSKYVKYSAKLFNPLTRESLIIDCPSNINKPSILWTAEYVLKQIKKEEPILYEEISKNFSRWSTNHSIVYIKKDPQRPDLENTLKIFKFRTQIDLLIQQQINPEQIDDLTPIKKINPYHLLEGKDFLCIVSKKTKDFRDWSKSKFMDEITPFIFKVGDKLVKTENTEKSIKQVSDFLAKNSPLLDDYLYKDWTEETYERVSDFMVAAINNKTVLNRIVQSSKDEKINKLILSKITKSKTNNPISSNEEELEFNNINTSNSNYSEKLDFNPSNNSSTDLEEEIFSNNETDEFDELFKDL